MEDTPKHPHEPRVSQEYEVATEEFDYLVHDGNALRARLYRPRGTGPFPAMVDAHGGAWIQGSCVNNDPINRPVSAAGVIVMAVDYRLPPDGTYPASVADVNFAIRWLKANAARLGSRPDWVGVMGTSSGGHLAALAAMKPHDFRYASIPLPGADKYDARVACAVTMWPVICPFTRYRDNLERMARGEQHHVGRVGAGLDQMKYWLNEKAMAEGSPMLALERGDQVHTPDLLYIQTEGDTLHPRSCMDRFCESYRRAGGRLEVELVPGEPYDLVRSVPDSDGAQGAVKRIVNFIRTCSEATGGFYSDQ